MEVEIFSEGNKSQRMFLVERDQTSIHLLKVLTERLQWSLSAFSNFAQSSNTTFGLLHFCSLILSTVFQGCIQISLHLIHNYRHPILN